MELAKVSISFSIPNVNKCGCEFLSSFCTRQWTLNIPEDLTYRNFYFFEDTPWKILHIPKPNSRRPLLLIHERSAMITLQCVHMLLVRPNNLAGTPMETKKLILQVHQGLVNLRTTIERYIRQHRNKVGTSLFGELKDFCATNQSFRQ